jgi:hypothetical protein
VYTYDGPHSNADGDRSRLHRPQPVNTVNHTVTNPFHATDEICCLEALAILVWIHTNFDISETIVSCHLSTGNTNCMWLLNNRNFSLPWKRTGRSPVY